MKQGRRPEPETFKPVTAIGGETSDAALTPRRLDALIARFDVLEALIRSRVETGIADIKTGQLETRHDIAEVIQRITGMEGRIETLEASVKALGANLHDTKTDLEARVRRLESAVDRLLKLERKRDRVRRTARSKGNRSRRK